MIARNGHIAPGTIHNVSIPALCRATREGTVLVLPQGHSLPPESGAPYRPYVVVELVDDYVMLAQLTSKSHRYDFPCLSGSITHWLRGYHLTPGTRTHLANTNGLVVVPAAMIPCLTDRRQTPGRMAGHGIEEIIDRIKFDADVVDWLQSLGFLGGRYDRAA